MTLAIDGSSGGTLSKSPVPTQVEIISDPSGEGTPITEASPIPTKIPKVSNTFGIREGMSVYVEFVAAEAIDVLVVPVSAVKNVNGKPSVQMESGEWKPVTTGFTDGKLVEIIKGLNPADKVLYVK